VSGQLHAPAALPGEIVPGTHWIGGWVGPRAVLDTVVKRKIHIFLGMSGNILKKYILKRHSWRAIKHGVVIKLRITTNWKYVLT
jgi:hypothetical protein